MSRRQKKMPKNRKTMTSWDDSYLRSAAQCDNGPTIWITWFGLDPCMADIFRATFLCRLAVKYFVAVTNRFVTCSLVQTYILRRLRAFNLMNSKPQKRQKSQGFQFWHDASAPDSETVHVYQRAFWWLEIIYCILGSNWRSLAPPL